MIKILSIVIPTFNRIDSLQQTLKSLSFLSKKDEIEILVVDNNSNDGTWEWLSSDHEKTGITIKRNPFNLGIEGNIIHSLCTAQGEYIWLLSDHMTVRKDETIDLINKIQRGLKFTLGYARIGAYEKVLCETYVPTKLKDIDPISLGKIMFFMGNISAFIVNREHLSKCGRSLFRFSSYSYPQLGVFLNASSSDTLVEIDIVSDFALQKKSDKPKRISYDTFRSRFIGFVLALEEIQRLNPNIHWSYRALETKLLIAPLISDSIYCLCSNNSLNYSDFAFCFTRYPGKMRLFMLVCIFLSLLPPKLQIRLSNSLFKLLPSKLYIKAMNRQPTITSESILE